MVIHPLQSGVRIEAGRGSIATVDVGRHRIDVCLRDGTRRAFAASRAGLCAAVELLLWAMSSARSNPGKDGSRTLQGDLFAASPTEVPGKPSREVVEQYVVAALRRAARAVVDTIDDVEVTVASVCGTPLVFSPAVLNARFFRQDILRFRPAAIAAASIETLLMETMGPDGVGALSPQLDAWRGLYSPDGVARRSVNKTLDVFADASAADLWSLRRIALEQPVRSGLHLRVLAERANSRPAHREQHLVLLQRAGEAELLDLIARVVHALRLPSPLDGDLPKEHVHAFAELVAGAGPVMVHGGLGALVDAALVAGRPRRRLQAWHRPVPLEDAMPAKLPPIPLPMVPGCRFLATVGEIIQEGESMRHCIGTRALAAVRGDAFLFHVELGAERASVEVDTAGQVVEVSGPCNTRNAACDHAVEVLKRWGHSLLLDSLGEAPSATDGVAAVTR
jgi:hypothetical protein